MGSCRTLHACRVHARKARNSDAKKSSERRRIATLPLPEWAAGGGGTASAGKNVLVCKIAPSLGLELEGSVPTDGPEAAAFCTAIGEIPRRDIVDEDIAISGCPLEVSRAEINRFHKIRPYVRSPSHFCFLPFHHPFQHLPTPTRQLRTPFECSYCNMKPAQNHKRSFMVRPGVPLPNHCRATASSSYVIVS